MRQDRRRFTATTLAASATLPLYRGTSQGRVVWFIVFDSSDGNDADLLGVNRSQKLGHLRGTAAVQRARVVYGVIDFPKTVDFRPRRIVVAGPGGARFGPGGFIVNCPIVSSD